MCAHQWLRLDKIKEDSFRGECDAPGPKSRAFGGQVLAQALTAAASTVPKGFYVNSLHCYFIRGGIEKEPIIYEVERIRNGQNFCIRTVEAVQTGSVIHSSEFSFQKEENASSFAVSPVFPSVKPPEDLETYTFSREQFLATGKDHTLIRPLNIIRIAPRCEIRPIDGDIFLQGLLNPLDEPLKQYAWFRYLDKVDSNDPALAQATIAYMSDLSLVNVGLMPYTRGTRFKLSTTLDHSMWYHQWRFDVNEWILYEMICVAHAANRSLVHGRMWTRTGTLIMSSTQEVLTYPNTAVNGLKNAKL